MAVDTLGHLLAVHVTPANEQERAQVREVCGGCRRSRAAQSSWPGPSKAIRKSNPSTMPEPTG
jgi:hypothetical protein